MFSHKSRHLFILCSKYGKHCHLNFSFIVRKNSQIVNGILSKLNYDLKSNADVNVSSIIAQLERVNPEWPHLLNGQSILASAVHQLHENSCHNEVNIFANILLDRNYKILSGLSTTILKSYIGQKSWKQAISWFEDMKAAGQLKHLRVYNELIKALAEDDLLKLAFHYFKEASVNELHMKTSKVKSISKETLIQLLHCACRFGESSLLVDLSNNYMKIESDGNFIVDEIIAYLENRVEPISNELAHLLGKLLQNKKTCSVNITSQMDNKCLHCNADLMVNSEFSDLCEDMLVHIGREMEVKGFHKDLDYLRKLLVKFEYFDVLIDAGNIMYHGTKSNKVFSPVDLKTLLENMQNYQARNIVLVFPQSFHKPGKLQKLTFIEEIRKANILNFQLSSVALKRPNDDLVLFYLAASSELFLQRRGRSISIISNDNYNDHRFFAGDHQHRFLHWLYHRQKKVDLDGNIDNARMSFPVVRCGGTRKLHINSDDGIVVCVKEK